MFRATEELVQVALVESIVSGDTVQLVAWEEATSSWQPSVMATRGEGVGEWTPVELPDAISGLLDGVVTLGVVNQAIQDAIDPDGKIDQAIGVRIGVELQPGGLIDLAIQAALDARLGPA